MKKDITPKEIAKLQIDAEMNRSLGHLQSDLAYAMKDVSNYEDDSKKTDWMTETDYEVAKSKIPMLQKKIDMHKSVSIGKPNGITIG